MIFILFYFILFYFILFYLEQSLLDRVNEWPFNAFALDRATGGKSHTYTTFLLIFQFLFLFLFLLFIYFFFIYLVRASFTDAMFPLVPSLRIDGPFLAGPRQSLEVFQSVSQFHHYIFACVLLCSELLFLYGHEFMTIVVCYM